MTYILARKSVSASAKLLAANLGLKRRYEIQRNAPLIRWGNSDGDASGDTELNIAELIGTCGNKRRFSDYFAELEIPHLHLRTGIPDKFPVVVRQVLSGSRGAGIVVCSSLQEYKNTPQNRHWTLWQPFAAEFGVHMLGGEVVKVMRKVREEELEKEQFPIRNSGRGYSFRRCDFTKKGKLVEFMKHIHDKFPLQFGRWDIGWNNDTKSYVVIEANSAPDLTQNEETLGLYVNFLRERIGK